MKPTLLILPVFYEVKYMYCVYIHTFPNGKIYVGQSQNADKRWENGKTYQHNKDMDNDINYYGWDNIRHEIICFTETREEAEDLEKIYIIMLKAENPKFGYNKTSYRESLEKQYYSRKAYKELNPVEWTQEDIEKCIFEKKLIPISLAKSLIEEYVYIEKHRKIYERRVLDGISFAELKEEFGISERQLKRIIKRWDDVMESVL